MHAFLYVHVGVIHIFFLWSIVPRCSRFTCHPFSVPGLTKLTSTLDTIPGGYYSVSKQPVLHYIPLRGIYIYYILYIYVIIRIYIPYPHAQWTSRGHVTKGAMPPHAPALRWNWAQSLAWGRAGSRAPGRFPEMMDRTGEFGSRGRITLGVPNGNCRCDSLTALGFRGSRGTDGLWGPDHNRNILPIYTQRIWATSLCIMYGS